MFLSERSEIERGKGGERQTDRQREEKEIGSGKRQTDKLGMKKRESVMGERETNRQREEKCEERNT